MEKATRATIYLGANIDGKPSVTDTDFSLFLEDYVTPDFPGFTVRETVGYWKGKRERAWELVILGPVEGGGIDNFKVQMELIARDYKRQFRQEAVMLSFETVEIEWDVPDDCDQVNDPLCPVTQGV